MTDISDHFASVLIIKNNESHQYERPMIRIFSEANKAKFKDQLSKKDLSNVLSSYDANECTIKFTAKVTKCFESAFPQQKLSKSVPKTNLGSPTP